MDNKIWNSPDFLRVEKPSRYTGGEWNGVYKENPLLRIALAFPDSYEIAQSGLGLKILYEIVNSIPEYQAERVFAPMPDMEGFMKERGGVLTSLESETPLNRFDIVGFTLQYPLTYTNILYMLDIGGIPIKSRDRSPWDPLIIAGGPCSVNPEPLAEFIDAFLIGDGEKAIVDICQAYQQWKEERDKENKTCQDQKEENKMSKLGLLKALSQIPGVYVPSFYDVVYNQKGGIDEIKPLYDFVSPRVLRAWVWDLDKYAVPEKPIVPFIQTVHDRVVTEIARGCNRGCRFCSAGFVYRPVRERNPESLIHLIETGIKNTGYEEISLLSLSCSDYSAIDELINHLSLGFKGKGVSISLPSLRIDAFSLELAEKIKTSRKTGLTFAPEAGSQRLRDVINKNVTEEDLFHTLEQVKKKGWDKVKLYFMIGLPTETEEDLEEMIRLVHGVIRKTRLELHVSVSLFVPSPHTPFQWEDMEEMESLRDKAMKISKRMTGKKIRFNWHEPKTSRMEGIFARGDRRLSAVIERAYRQGCRFDGWNEFFQYQKWMSAFEEEGLEPDFYLKGRGIDEILPWDHIDIGVSRDFLLKEREKAYKGETTADCRWNGCGGCGVCQGEVQNRLVIHGNRDKEDREEDKPIISAQDREQEEGILYTQKLQKVRVRLSRVGKLSLISHLDVQRVLERVLKRSGIPVTRTQGFHPRPRFSIAVPLSLGYSTHCEWVEVFLYKRMDVEELARDLGKQLPVGMKVEEIKEVPVNEASIMSYPQKVSYRVRVNLKEGVLRDLMESRLREFMDSSEVLTETPKRTVNIRRAVAGMSWYFNEVNRELEILMETLITPEGSVKPSMVTEYILGRENIRYARYHREKVLLFKNSRWNLP